MMRDGLIDETSEWLNPSVGPKYISFVELTSLVPGNADISNVFHNKSPRQESLLRHLESRDSIVQSLLFMLLAR